MKTPLSRGRLWSSRILGWLVIVFMLMDSIMKFMKPKEVVDGTLELGFAEHHIAVIGLLGLIATLLFAIPRTSILGLLFLTGYFGGVVATHIRMDNPLFSHTLFPVYLAVLAWGSVWLKDERVRTLLPFNLKA